MIWVKAFFIWLFRPTCICDQYYGMQNEDCKVHFPKETDDG